MRWGRRTVPPSIRGTPNKMTKVKVVQMRTGQLTSSEHWGLKHFVTDFYNMCHIFLLFFNFERFKCEQWFCNCSSWKMSRSLLKSPSVTSKVTVISSLCRHKQSRVPSTHLRERKALHQDFLISADAQRHAILLREHGQWVSLNVEPTCFPCQWK